MLSQTIKSLINAYWPFTIGLGLGICFITLNILGYRLTMLPGDLGDTRYCIYLLEHFHQYIIGNVNDYWSAPFMIPERNVITYSENFLGVAAFFSIFRIFGFSVETSFQLFYLLMVILNYTCCYLFLQKTIINKYAAAIGAMIFAFSMGLQGQLEHAQTFPRFWIPLSFLFAVLFIQKFRPVHFILICCFVVLQMMSSLYLGLMLLIPIGIFFILSIAFQYKEYISKLLNVKSVAFIISGIAIPIFLLLQFLKPYMARADKAGYNSLELVMDNVPRIESYFFTKEGTLLWEFLNNTGIHLPRYYNQFLFVGAIAFLLVLLFAFIGLKKWISPTYKFLHLIRKPFAIFTLSGLITFLLYLRVGDFSFYSIIYDLPGYGSIRAVARIINIELLFVAFAAAYVLKLFFNKQKKLLAVYFVFIAILFTIDNYYTKEGRSNMTKRIVQERTAALMNKLIPLPAGTIFSYEPDSLIDLNYVYHLDAMLAAQALQLKTLNGYTATTPVGYGPYYFKPNKENRLMWMNKNSFNENLVIVK